MLYPYPVFASLPWFNNSMLSISSIRQLPEVTPIASHPHSALILKLIDRLLVTESEIPDFPGADLHHFLQFTAVATPEERARFIDEFNPERLSKCVSHLLTYRLVDIVLSTEAGFGAFGQPCRLPIPLPQKMHYREFSNWKLLLKQGIASIMESDNLGELHHATEETPIAGILVSLVNRNQLIKGHKILANLECAAMSIALLQQSINDFPTTVPEFRRFLMSLVPSYQQKTTWDAFFASVKSVHSFKLPLQLATALSPIALFLPSLLMTKDLNRFYLFWTWQGLGGPRCPLLASAEAHIWSALLDIAAGKASFLPRLRVLLRHLTEIVSQAGGADNWLSPDPGFLPALNRLRQERKKSAAQASETNDKKVKLVEAEPSTSTRPTTRSTTRASSPKPANTKPTTRKGPVLPSGSSRSAKMDRSAPTDALRTADIDLPVARVISLAEHLVEPEAGLNAGARKRRLLEGRIVEIIDLTRETAGPPIIDLTLDMPMSAMSPFLGHRRVFPSLAGRKLVSFIPTFKFEKDLSRCQAILEAVERCYVDGAPLHLAQEDLSCLTVVSPLAAAAWSSETIQRAFGQRSLVFIDLPLAPYGFDSTALNHIAMLNLGRIVAIQDFSLSPEDRKDVFGSLRQILDAASTRSKPLSAPCIPMPDGVCPPLSLSSDVVAWNYTLDQPWCGHHWEMPRSALKWGSASLAETFLPLKIALNGCATYLEVKAGLQLVIVCAPKTDPALFFSTGFLFQARLNPFHINLGELQYEAFPLRAGCAIALRPFTPYAIITIEDAISHSSAFLSSSTIRSSCAGFMYSFVSQSSRENPTHQACRMVFRRLVHYYHLAYSSGLFLECYASLSRSAEIAHIPDVLTFDGVVDLLAVCNLFEMANILSYERYTPEGVPDYDRYHFIHARKLCREIIHWVKSRFLFIDKAGHEMDIHQVQMRYLARQSQALLDLRRQLDNVFPNSAINAQAMEAAFDSCFAGNDGYSESAAELRGLAPDSLSYPLEWSFKVHPRFTVESIPEHIAGENPDDLRES
ncbi:hypothetical protein BKA70DRAFT_1427768 [Coprinopsis sp. MPI-PUGE-AT-0042]|nr:hypothetical protein BKA70DRAFT_1427768 [Coprinopsis sp. MPI-PUGE-AT-0042]